MKKVMFFMALISFGIGLMSACSEVKTDVKNLEGKWTITEVNGEKVEAERMPFIEFNIADLKVHGNAGCNTFNAPLTLDPNNISGLSIGNAAATMMACLDMELEGKVFKALGEVKYLKAGSNTGEIQLLDKNKNVLFVLSKQ